MSEPVIVYRDRRSGLDVHEQVFGDAMVRFFYRNPTGAWIGHHLMSRRWLSQLVGWFQSSPLSRFKISSFIRDYEIPMEEFEPGPFPSFNDFFTRRFKPGMRSFVISPTELAAPAEGRYLAYRSVDPEQTFPVKGQFLSSPALLGSAGEHAKTFAGGPLIIARLCPVDYHRFHFPDDGEVASAWEVPGRLHSVNPFALTVRPDVFATNFRVVSILSTRHFGRLAYIEVGAMCVGRIIQSYDTRRPFSRGEEKGMFLFGGSTIVLLGEAGAWRPDQDLLDLTAARRETLVRLGERIGTSSPIHGSSPA